MKQKLVSVVTFVAALIIWAASASPAHAQTSCDDAFGEGTYIAGTFFPSARPDWNGVGYPYCGPADYAQIYSRNFGAHGMLDWLPMGGVPRGGVWGRRGPQGYEPVLDGCERPLGGRQRIERAAGIPLLGGGIGRAVGGERGGWIGLVIGAAGAAINDSRYESRAEYEECLEDLEKRPVSLPQGQVRPPSPVPPGYQQPTTQPSGRTPIRSSRREPRFRVVNTWPVDCVLHYDSNEDETWVARRRSSSLRIPQREGNLTATCVTTETGGFREETPDVIGDGEKFVISAP